MLEEIVSNHIETGVISTLNQLPLSNKTKWLLHINFLDKITMKEDIFNIQLIKWPRTHSNHGEKETDISNLGNRGECVTIIRTINLSISFSNQAGLKAINLAIRTNLNRVNPTTTNWKLTKWQKNKILSVS